MRAISNILAAAILVLSPAAIAQQGGPPQVGFIRIINAIAPGEGNAIFKVNGEDIYAKGYKLGQRTGGIGIPAGHHEISVEKTGIQAGTTRIELETGETLSLIAFAERLPPEDPNNAEEPPKWQIRILRLKQNDVERGFRASFVSVCDLPEVRLEAAVLATNKVEAVAVKRLDMATLDLGGSRGEVLIRVGEEIITTISPESPGNYVVLLYQDAEGVVRGISFYDPKFVIAG